MIQEEAFAPDQELLWRLLDQTRGRGNWGPEDQFDPDIANAWHGYREDMAGANRDALNNAMSFRYKWDGGPIKGLATPNGWMGAITGATGSRVAWENPTNANLVRQNPRDPSSWTKHGKTMTQMALAEDELAKAQASGNPTRIKMAQQKYDREVGVLRNSLTGSSDPEDLDTYRRLFGG